MVVSAVTSGCGQDLPGFGRHPASTFDNVAQDGLGAYLLKILGTSSQQDTIRVDVHLTTDSDTRETEQIAEEEQTCCCYH